MRGADGNPVSGQGREINPWLFFALGHLVASLGCLIQWGAASPWARVDLFSGGYLLMRALPTVRSIFSPFRERVPTEGRRERYGSTSVPSFLGFTLALSVAELAIYLDYGHWHLAPGLQQPIAQWIGLLLHLAVAVWNRWTSKYHQAAFAENRLLPQLVRSGPFGHVRHPIYAGAMIQKAAAALVFGSAVGWLLAALWWIMLLYQVRVEEAHLRELFGEEYEVYARQTPKLVPRIF